MNAQDILIRLLKADHITEEEFKLLYGMTTESNQITFTPNQNSNPWFNNPPIITYKDHGGTGVNHIHPIRNTTDIPFSIRGSSGFSSGPTISVTNTNKDVPN